MFDQFFHLLRDFFHQYGYWTVGVALLLENAGIPLPGETTLLFASFLAYSEGKLHLPTIMLTGTIAATLGDNLGYLIGFYGGRRLLERYQRVLRISPQRLGQGEKFFQQHGPPAIFFARFLFGMRIFAGPLAGMLRMRWKRFLLYNFLGALTWVITVAALGYYFGSQWEKLLGIMKGADIALLAVAAALVALWWHRQRRGNSASIRG